jgi:3-deoxy-D-manno-octulosonic-acid transferase
MMRIRSERPDISFLFTPDDQANGAETEYLTAQPTPEDTGGSVRRFLDHWRPDIAVWTELDLRPAMLCEIADRDLPLLFVPTRTSSKAALQAWPKSVAGDLLASFDLFLAADQDAATQLQQLGVAGSQIETLGMLEGGSPAPGCNEAERADLAAQLGGRPIWAAISVTEDEREAVIAAHLQALRRSHRLLLLLVPDDPAQGARWAQELAKAGLPVALRSADEEPLPETQIYIGDSEGEEGLWYRLAPIAYLGRSGGGGSEPKGTGISPYAAAALGSAIIHGPGVAAHKDAYTRFGGAGAAWQVGNVTDLGEAVNALLSPARAAEMARHGWEISSAGADVTDRVIDLILTKIERA